MTMQSVFSNFKTCHALIENWFERKVKSNLCCLGHGPFISLRVIGNALDHSATALAFPKAEIRKIVFFIE